MEKKDCPDDMPGESSRGTRRVYKKSSPSNNMTMYLPYRDLVVDTDSIDRIQGVLHVDPEQLDNKKLYGQVTLTFRYGREDEEVMGLKFCNEAIMSLAQVWPLNCNHEREPRSDLQEALMRRLGAHAYPFQLDLSPLAPPSVQLVPAKEYKGAPIGTSYDVRAFVEEKVEDKLSRRNMVRMGIRVLQGASRAAAAAATLPPESPARKSFGAMAYDQLLRLRGRMTQPEVPAKEEPEPEAGQSCKPAEPAKPVGPRVVAEKAFLLSDGRLRLETWLDKSAYHHGEPIVVSFLITNYSNKTVRRIKAVAIQHVEVCMFSDGKFKNTVALLKDDTTRILPGYQLEDEFMMILNIGVTKNWIALEDSYSKSGAYLASTVLCNSNSPEDRNVFAIYVSYYVKMKLNVRGICGELSVKLPFSLSHANVNETPPNIVLKEVSHRMILEGSDDEDDDNEDKEDGDATAGENQQSDLEEDPEADICVNIIENKLCERPCFEGAAQVSKCRIEDDDDMNLIVRYHGPNT